MSKLNVHPSVMHSGIAVLLAGAVVLPPMYLAMYIFVIGMCAFTWKVFFQRNTQILASAFTIVISLALAAFFCLLGAFPITNYSDFHSEFLKYSVYAVAFIVGLLLLDQREKNSAFITSVIIFIYAFYILAAFTSGLNFSIDQSWHLYPPDQNNSSSILAPFSAVILSFRPRWLKVVLLSLLFIFFTFVESRFGVLVIFIVSFFTLVLDWRSGIVVIAIIALITGLLSLSNVGASTTIMRVINEVKYSSTEVPPDSKRISRNRIVEFGSYSDNTRLKIYDRALHVSKQTFPNLIGMGDREVVVRLNTPRIDDFNMFQHAHNFFLQSYLSYGLLATLCMIFAAANILVYTIRTKSWYILGAIVIISAYGMIEALISDLRVLTIMMMFFGSATSIMLKDSRKSINLVIKT